MPGVCSLRNGTSTVVTSIFGGVLQNEVNCLICGTESRKFDPFLGEPPRLSFLGSDLSRIVLLLLVPSFPCLFQTFP